MQMAWHMFLLCHLLNSLIPHIFEQESFVQRGFERFIPLIITYLPLPSQVITCQ